MERSKEIDEREERKKEDVWGWNCTPTYPLNIDTTTMKNEKWKMKKWVGSGRVGVMEGGTTQVPKLSFLFLLMKSKGCFSLLKLILSGSVCSIWIPHLFLLFFFLSLYQQQTNFVSHFTLLFSLHFLLLTFILIKLLLSLYLSLVYIYSIIFSIKTELMFMLLCFCCLEYVS